MDGEATLRKSMSVQAGVYGYSGDKGDVWGGKATEENTHRASRGEDNALGGL